MSAPDPRRSRRRARLHNVAWAGLALLSLGALTAASLPASSAPPPPPKDSLAASASALLAKHCLHCHGEQRRGGLDLRTREGILAGGAHGPVIKPGNPAGSSLLRYLGGKGVPQMPPGKPLSTAERELLQQWIEAGAPWPAKDGKSSVWWSFRQLKRPPLPPVKLQGWVRNPIDAFVLARLEESGLRPAPTADPATLIRRLYFDLTGLPPSPEEVEAFVKEWDAERRVQGSGFRVQEGTKPSLVKQNSPPLGERGTGGVAPNSSTSPGAGPWPLGHARSAYERLVDRLLASPRYGERWARHWLDVARFAESQGFERDKIRPNAWRYRDWVIRAFNSDMPYDRFVQCQIAGDVFPDATRDSVIATGFLVAGPYDEVGNQQASEVMKARVREDELEDIVSAVGQTFLGLSVNCARCHDHKFDPISQKEYYAFQAVFAGVRHGDRSILPPGEAAARDAEIRSARARVDALTAEISKLDQTGRQRVAARRTREGLPGAEPPIPPVLRWTFDTDARDAVAGVELTLSGGASLSEGRLRLDGKDDRALSGPLPLTLKEKTLEAWVSLSDLSQRGGSALTVEAEEGRQFDALVFGERQPKKWIAGSDSFRRTRDVEAPEESATPGEVVHIAAVYSAEGRISLYRNGKPYGAAYTPASGPGGGLQTFAGSKSRVLLGHRHTGSSGAAWLAGEIEEARVYHRALTEAEVAGSFAVGVGAIRPEEALAALTPEERSRRIALTSEAEGARKHLKDLEDIPKVYAANAGKPPEIYLLQRGDVQKKGEKVAPAALSCVPNLSAAFALPADAPEGARRRKLAEWLTSPANPLTPRVMVNRVWQYHFGRGLAASPSDFGVNGELPTHPELLDWLAAAFAAGEIGSSELGTPDALPAAEFRLGWSLKRLHRLIVTSNTYKQSGRFDPRASALDSENTLLWRRAPRRMDAEELRDAMLAVSGQLNLQEGGPGFRPFNVVESNSHFYTYEDKLGPEFNRRSIYRTVVNSGEIPLLEAFDCPDPSVKTPRRATTTTPMQSLALLNNSFVLRQSREFAKRLETEAGPDRRKQVALAYRWAFGRSASPAEQERAASFAGAHGLSALCRVLFNASEFVYVR